MSIPDMNKSMAVLLIWDGSDFIPADVGKRGIDDIRDTLLFIDEAERKIYFRMGADLNLTSITKRIINRQFLGIAKTGYHYKSKNLRIGKGFTTKEVEGELDVKKFLRERKFGPSTVTKGFNRSTPVQQPLTPVSPPPPLTSGRPSQPFTPENTPQPEVARHLPDYGSSSQVTEQEISQTNLSGLPVSDPILESIDPVKTEPTELPDSSENEALRLGKLILRHLKYGHTLIIKTGTKKPDITVYKSIEL